MSQALAVLEGERKARVEACEKEITAILKKYKCDLLPRVIVLPGQQTEINVALVPM